MTVQTEISSSEAVFRPIQLSDARPEGSALDLTADRVAALTAQVQQLHVELHWAQLALDDLSEDASPINEPEMERLTQWAMSERLHTPRARHATASTSQGRVLWRLAHPLRPRRTGVALGVA
ncbi:hypothetical protein [Nocardia niigatensis]|uniref:hypothetical protein n=1 Tax=Nocardia niigatensis TaxID=209249 RepID=UPI0005926554|nr:hypothetical protein [Nocardia niigatensis]